MGADIYLGSVNKKQRELYEPEFQKWVNEHNRLKRQGDDFEAEKALEQVDFFYEKMNERGYFRDSYNSTSLMHLLNLSWWRPDVKYGYFETEAPFNPIPEPDEDYEGDWIYGWGKEACQAMLDLINERMQDGTFQRCFDTHFGPANIRKNDRIYQDMELTPEEDSAGWLRMFVSKYERFTSLLREAIELEEPLRCSV